jgi:general secretion pathway protein J
MTQHRIASGGRAGFTLLELLVALVIFGLLLTAMAQATRSALTASDLQARHIQADQDLDAVDRTLRHLIGTMDGTALASGAPRFIGNSRSMEFTAVLPAMAPLVAWQADVRIAVEAGHRLVLRWAPHYDSLLGAPPLPRVTDLLDGVDHVELSYWVHGAARDGWVDRWQAAALPELVRLHIAFPPGDSRHWPDIVAATGPG